MFCNVVGAVTTESDKTVQNGTTTSGAKKHKRESEGRGTFSNLLIPISAF